MLGEHDTPNSINQQQQAAQMQQSSANTLQQIIEEERNRRIEAENYSKALVEEFSQCSDFEETRQLFRDKIKEFAPAALVNIINLANNAESESVRANLNKWVLDWAMSDRIDTTGSELQAIISGLKNDPQPDTLIIHPNNP